MRKLIKLAVTLGHIGIPVLLLMHYFLLDYFYFRQNDYPENYLYIYQAILFFLFLSYTIKNPKGKKIFDRIIFSIINAIIIGYISIPIATQLYTAFFGERIEYHAIVYDKYRETRKRTIFHYIDVASEKFGIERFDNVKLFAKVKSGTQIVIRKKKSALSSYIAYGDIQILKK